MATSRTERKVRTPINGIRTRLNVRGKDPDFEYYIVNDVDDRVDRHKEAGWEVVTESSVSIGERRVSAPTSEGTAKTVSVGQGVTGVLMRIKREWWEQDQQTKHENAKNSVNATLAEARKSGDYGTITRD
jgi:hypothetical protein